MRPHLHYTGQKHFFPPSLMNNSFKFSLETLPDQGDDPKYLREALFRFMINVAYLNTQKNEKIKNYSFLVHTSGKQADHTRDYRVILDSFAILKDKSHEKYNPFLQKIFNMAQKKYNGYEDGITRYVMENADSDNIIVMT